jgi:hypothetical protein
MRMRFLGAGAVNLRLRFTVAVWPSIEKLRSRVPAGIAVFTPAADSAALGPASSSRMAVRPGNVASGAVRLECHSRADRLNHTE